MENGYLVISDLDGTLLGDDKALDEVAQWHSEHRQQVKFVYNSGRLVGSMRESIESTALPQPAAIIGGVGTQIFDPKTDRSIEDWPLRSTRWQPTQLCSVISDHAALELQPREFLAKHKISCYFRNATPKDLANLSEQLCQANGGRVEMIYSSQRDLDILPSGVNKGTAAAFLAKRWSYPADRVIVCGDTGNDRAMFEQGFRGIVVGNALRELKSLNSERVYHAQRDCAGGVLEGLKYWLSN